MKKISLSFLFFIAFGFVSDAQYALNKEDFTSKFKTLFDIAKKRFPNEKKGEKKTINEGILVAAFDATTSFANATSTRMVIDSDNILGHESRFEIGKDESEAKKIMAEMESLIKANLPPKFVIRTTYDAGYKGSVVTVIEYDSEVFAIQSKNPTAKLGLKESNGIYSVELLIMEPVFKV